MHPAATGDDTVTLAPLKPAPFVSIHWAWPVTADLREQVYTCVAGAYEEWGAAEHQADMLAELACEFVETVVRPPVPSHVAVTAMIEGTRATLSAITAFAAEPPRIVQLTHRNVTMGTTWGRVDLTSGPCLYATVNLLVTPRRLRQWANAGTRPATTRPGYRSQS